MAPQTSIRRRLTLMSAASSSAALLLACGSFLVWELFTFRGSLVDDVSTDAQVLAFNVTAPLLFNDPDAATTSLEALKAKPRIRSAVVTDNSGRIFASYGKARSAPPLHVAGPWHGFEGDRLVLAVPVLSEGAPIGTLVLEASLEERDQRIRRYLLLTAAILLVALMTGLAISSRLQHRIVQPITELTDAARRVSRDSDYSVRVPAQLGDELGVLSAAFNDMIGRIGQQDVGLRASEARFTRLSESGMIGILVLDLAGTILEANDTFLTIVGLTRDELQPGVLRVQDITPPELRGISDTALDQIKREGTVGLFEKEYLHRDGSRVPVLIGGAMLDSKRHISFILDITERKRLEQARRDAFELETQNRRIQEASRMKSEFLANMSHELRTPLNAIIGFSELLHDGVVPPDSPKHQEYLGDVLRSGRHLLQLINDVLDLAKVEAGKVEFHPEEIDLHNVVDEVVSIVRAIAVAKSISLIATIDPALQGIFLDPARLKQILYNFVSNALKFTPENGAVDVRAIAEGEESFRLEVEDTGPGITPQDIDRLFVEFQQLEAGAGRQHSGTGLGLALTRRLAEAQGGSVGVHSTVGLGSVFYAVLPRRSVSRAEAPRVQPSTETPAGAPSVLVVEDDQGDQARLVEALRGAGYAVEAASSGAAALSACSRRKFGAISLDLLLPDMSGQEVLRRIRTDGPNRDVPVVVVTVIAERGVMAGFTVQDFLTKPIESRELISALSRAGVRPDQPGAVLVVDDDESSRKLMAAALTQLGYRSVAMQSGEEALRAIAVAPPAAVVLDLLMPGMDGFEFLDRLRDSPATRQTPVLIWTVKDLSAQEGARLHRSVQAIARKGHGGIPALLEDLRRFLSPRRAPVEQNVPVLVVDDHPINLKLVSRLLLAEGYDVRTAGHADEALQTLETFHPRLILMDIQMPGMDGLTLTRKLKAAPATRDIVIVALTAYAMKGDAEKAREAGCDGYISKPIDTRTLSATLASYLAPSATEKAG
jgi:PAS domain S-box-containing protein